MIIHLQNCSLTIAHIGTVEEIEVQIMVERALGNAAQVGRQLAETINEAFAYFREACASLVTFLNSDTGKELANLYGVGNK